MASNSRSQLFLFGFAFVTLVLLLPPPPYAIERQNSVEAAKTLKALAKTFVFQRLTQSKHFVPLPVPIPVPIEIEEKPVYLKGKPKYVNVYKPKPTPQPATKPTTVYHMPIYSPTYEYMSVDPMSSMYSSPMMYAGSGQHGSSSSYKSSLGTSGDSTSSSAAGGHSAVDYDDDAGSYYMRKAAAARRNKLSLGDYPYEYNLQRNDDQHDQHDDGEGESEQHDLETSASNEEEASVEAPQVNEDESYDHEDETVARRRVKRQVYYQSGYNGETKCDGFPLEVNVRSRIKLDRIFPIHGKSQMKKCIKIKKTLLPPPSHDDGHIDVLIPQNPYPPRHY